jgi:eukaryotic-like serine/threonine-protein kinase
MKTNIACPQTEELRQLLDSSLSDERQVECMEHMDSCPCCQSRIESVATEGTNLSEIVRGIHETGPAATSAYWPALQSMESTVQEPVRTVATKTRDTALHFLKPANDSAYLGRIAHFDVMRVLGRGGMGVVLEAFDSRLHRNVALKILDPDLLGDEVAQQRFCREARAAASITHENVVAVHQVERAEDGLPYLVMQVIGGESLEQRLAREKKLPFPEVVRIGMQAAQGLAAAHSQGLTHRDIKPGNIMLEAPSGRVKLTDFGLARVAEDVKLTHTGYVSGTPLYMAPEQAMGEQPDHRSDLFSLGAIMYEMCAGQPPFTGSSPLVILKQVAEAKHRPLRELNPDVPDWLSKTIDLLLAKKPADRIQTATQLAELLEFEWALTKTSSEELPQVCQIEARKEAIRNRLIAGSIGATFLTVGLMAGWFFAHRPAAPGEVAGAPVEPFAVLPSNAGAIRSVSFDRTDKTIAMAVEDGSIRLWDWPTQSIKSTVNAHKGSIWSARFSPNGEIVATAGDDGWIKLWKTAEPVLVSSMQRRAGVLGLAFAPDGKSFYSVDRDGGLCLWALDSAKPKVEATQNGEVNAIALSPDGETLATGGGDKIVIVWNAKTLTQKLPLVGHAGPIRSLAFHPDGKRLASVGWDKIVRIWDAGSGRLVKSWPGHDADIWGVAFSPDGTKLATSSLDGVVKLWNPDSGDLLATYGDQKNATQTIAFSADGKLLAAGCRDGAVRIWKVE